MPFRKIEYLEWARTHMGRVRFDLAKSNIKALSPAELGFDPAAVPLNAPSGGFPELRDLIAKRCGLPAAQVLVTGGATMGIFLACAALLRDGDQAILESPHYEPLSRAAEQHGAELRLVERRFERGFQVELEEFERIVGRGVRAILLTNLHNPSGAATSPERMTSLGQIARDVGATVIVSEPYLDGAFTPGLKPAAACGPNLVSIGSLSKVYGLGGLRIGWIAGPEALVAAARLALDYVECELPAPSEAIALQALRKAPEIVARFRSIAGPNLETVAAWIEKRGDLEWVRPDGGTICLVRLPKGVDSQALATLLREKHSTLVVPGDFFGLHGTIRLSFGIDEEILRQGLKNVSRAIDQLLE